MKFKPTNRRNPCPICSDIKGKCRITETELVLCMTAQGDEPGWKNLGPSKNGLWTKFIPVTAQDEAKQERRKQYEEAKAEAEQLKIKSRSQSLGRVARDWEIRKLLAQLPLHPEDRNDLERRGLTPEQIRSGMFRSVETFQKLTERISPQLAGINVLGLGMTNSQAGYLCPTWNSDGLITGWQLRLRNPEAGGRYRWPKSSKNRNRAIDATAHLKESGELPLTLVRGQDLDLRLSEGILKPWIAGGRRGLNFLGAAGGQFAASPEEFKQAIAAINPQRVILCPDAGAIDNPHVLNQYRNLRNLAAELGYELWVETWEEQDSKSGLDVDEIPPETQTTIIPYLEYDIEGDCEISYQGWWQRHGLNRSYEDLAKRREAPRCNL